MTSRRGFFPCVAFLALVAEGAWAAVGASEAAAAFAARAALSAIQEVDAIEARVRQLEDADAVRAGTALEAHSSIHEDLGSLLEVALSATRHAAAAHAAAPSAVEATSGELAQLATVDKQLSELRVLQHKEPLFFWHGPKRMVLSKLRSLLVAEDSAFRRSLQALAGQQGSIEDILGGARDQEKELGDRSATGHVVPDFGLVLGEAECGVASSDWQCSFQDLAEDKTHLVVSSASAHALSRIGKLSRIGGSFLSLEVPAAVLKQGPSGLHAFVRQTLQTLGVPSASLLLLPYSAFKKKMWESLKAALAELLEAGSVGSLGAAADESNATLVRKLFDREPKPVAWLTTHDLSRQAGAEALAVAHELGVSVVARPRMPGTLPAAAPYSRAVAGEGLAEQASVQPRWSAKRGLAVVARPDVENRVSLGSIQQRLKNPLAASEASFLDLAALAVSPSQLDTEDGSTGSGLGWALRQGRRATAQADPEQLSAEAVFPSVRDATLASLDEQAQTYKDNNHVIYQADFFDNATWSAITAETKRLWASADLEANCNLDGVNRLGGYVLDASEHESSLYKLIYGNERFRRWVSAVNGEGEMWPSDFPMELREYGRKSAGMGCHSDLQMYAVAKLDLEFAVTVENDSGCKVTYYDADNKVHEVHTKGNSVMMVRAGGAVHCVSSTEGGSRTILKFIYVGDYHKGKAFWRYTGNVCDDSNPNRKSLLARRNERSEL